MREQLAAVAARWGRLGGLERGCYVAMGLLCLAAFLGRPAWGWLDPRLPVSEAFHAGAPVDPWGQPWGGLTDAGGFLATHSIGRDGRDEHLDVLPRAGADDVPLLWARSRQLAVYGALRELLLGLAVVLAASFEGARALRRHWTAPRSPDLAREATRCALLALPPAALTAGLAWLAALLAPAPAAALERGLAGALLVPFPVAVGLACYGLALLIVVGARAGRPRADELGA